MQARAKQKLEPFCSSSYGGAAGEPPSGSASLSLLVVYRYSLFSVLGARLEADKITHAAARKS